MPRERIASLGWMLVLLLLACGLGMRLLQADALWFDEAKTVLFNGARHFGPLTLAQVWDNLAQNDPWQSPGYFLLLGGWTQFVGWSDLAARALALYIGLVALALLYRAGARLFGAPIGLYAAALLTGSALYIHYLHEMRPYALYLLTTCLSVAAYWRLVRVRRARARHYVLFGLGLAGLAYTHVLALLTAFGIAAFHLGWALGRLGRRPGLPGWGRWWGITLAAGGAALAFLPWLGYLLSVIGKAAVDERRQAAALFGGEIVAALAQGFANGSPGLLLLLLALALWGAWVRRPLAAGTIFVAVWLVVGTGAALLIGQLVPAFIHVRYAFALWPALALAGALGVAALHQRGVPPALVLGVWLALGIGQSWDTRFFESLPNAKYNLPQPAYRTLVQWVTTWLDPARDLLVVHSSAPDAEWDTDDTHLYYLPGIPYRHLELIQPIAREASEAAYIQAVRETLAERRVVWTAIFPAVPFSRRREAFYAALQPDFAHCAALYTGADLRLDVYARRMADPPQAVFAAGQVQAALLWPLPAAAPTELKVLLAWELAPALPPQTYSYSLRLLDDAGQMVSQADAGLPDAPFGCSYARLPTGELPPGEYTLALVVYAWQTGAALPTAAGPLAALGSVQR